MTEHFNGLTPSEDERLAMLAEEASEIIKAVTKIQRHGYESYNPDKPEEGSNRRQLRKEMTDLAAVWDKMRELGDIAPTTSAEVHSAWQRKLRYAHHQ